MLELGCGEGKLLREFVRGGATSGTGIDLSRVAVTEATRRSQQEGIGDRLTFVPADAAVASLAPHDVVVLDKVICCYVDYVGLLANSLPVARSTYAFTLPRTDGAWLPMTRIAIAIENLGHKIKRRGFRAYAHDERAIHRVISEAGFRLVERHTAFAWALRLYVRV